MMYSWNKYSDISIYFVDKYDKISYNDNVIISITEREDMLWFM